MSEETTQHLTTEEFNQLVDDFVAREDDRIEPSVILTAMAELERAHAVMRQSVETSVRQKLPH
jgi:hypothetical protein